MSIAIGYTADLSDRRDLASEVIRYCEGLTKQHSWEMESFDLRSDFAAGRLEGRTKFMPLAADQVTAGFRDLYARLSKSCTPRALRFNLSWRVQLEGIEGIVDANGPDSAIAALVRDAKKSSAADDEVRGVPVGNGGQPRASGLLRRATSL